MTISGDTLGTIQIGNLNSVTYNNSFQTPGVGSIGINSGTMSGFFPLQGFPTTSPDLSGDSMKINYITPSFNGFTLGLSYTPSVAGNSVNTGPINRNNNGAAAVASGDAQVTDVWGISADYNQSLGTVDLGLHASYQQGESTAAAAAVAGPAGVTTDPNEWILGANLGFDAFTVGMNYAETDADAGAATDKNQIWSLGATYNTGVWTFGADMIHHNYDAAGTGGADIEEMAYRIGASRDLGPGVAWDVFAIHYDGDDKGATATDLDGQMLGTAITLNF